MSDIDHVELALETVPVPETTPAFPAVPGALHLYRLRHPEQFTLKLGSSSHRAPDRRHSKLLSRDTSEGLDWSHVACRLRELIATNKCSMGRLRKNNPCPVPICRQWQLELFDPKSIRSTLLQKLSPEVWPPDEHERGSYCEPTPRRMRLSSWTQAEIADFIHDDTPLLRLVEDWSEIESILRQDREIEGMDASDPSLMSIEQLTGLTPIEIDNLYRLPSERDRNALKKLTKHAYNPKIDPPLLEELEKYLWRSSTNRPKPAFLSPDKENDDKGDGGNYLSPIPSSHMLRPGEEPARGTRILGGECFVIWERHPICGLAPKRRGRCPIGCRKGCDRPDERARIQAALAQDLCLGAAQLRRCIQPDDTRSHEILDRLLTDKRMARVWSELNRWSEKTNRFLYDLKPVYPHNCSTIYDLESRCISLQYILQNAVWDASRRIRVTKYDEIYEWALASVICEPDMSNDPAAAACRVRELIPSESNYYITRRTGDDEARAMSISMLELLFKITGAACAEMAETIASVALGRDAPRIDPSNLIRAAAEASPLNAGTPSA